MAISRESIDRSFALATERYAAVGVDVEQAMAALLARG